MRVLSIAAWSALTCASICDQRALGIDLLLVDRVGGRQLDVALKIELGIGERGLVLRLLGHRLIVERLVDGGIDLGQHKALGDVLPLGEGQGDELAVDLRADRDGIERFRGADAVEIDRHIGNPCLDRQHRHRIVPGLVPATACLCPSWGLCVVVGCQGAQ